MNATTDRVAFLSREVIEEKAADLRREAKVDKFPFDTIALAVRLGMTVAFTDFEDRAIVGMIHKGEEGWEILLRESGPIQRLCFTVAHELGHYVLHLRERDAGQFVDTDIQLYRMSEGSSSRDRVERSMEIQANMFAAALLMPEELVRSEWAIHRSVSKLAKTFGVSQLAMRYRIDQLELW